MAAMAKWLFKTEPDDYSYADLERDGRTIWDGVKNNWALIYHTDNLAPFGKYGTLTGAQSSTIC